MYDAGGFIIQQEDHITILGLLYGLPILLNTDQNLLKKLNLILIKTARCVIASYCYRFSYFNILKKVGWNSIYQLINITSIKLLKSIIIKTYPKPLYN